MSQLFLINNIRVGLNFRFAGELIDTAIEDPTPITDAGGVLVVSIPVVATAAAKARAIKLQGGDPNMMAGIMLASVGATADAAAIAAAQADATQALADAATAQGTADAAVPSASVQTGVGTLVAGTLNVPTANITAGSVIVPIRDVEDLVNSGALSISGITPGAPGSFDIDSANGADTSSVSWLVIG
jgi:hypothetical protein